MVQRGRLPEEQANLTLEWVLSVLFYGDPVWLTPHLLGLEMRRILSIHYSSLRIVIKDYRQRINCKWVTASTR